MKLKVYVYQKCGTCNQALKFLESKKIEFEKIPIRDNPPSIAEIKKQLQFQNGEIKKLFNTSGQDYRELNLKEKLPSMNLAEQIKLLSTNGNLVKRPFLLGEDFGLVGFKIDEWNLKFS
jgi:arsenate reductase (glutaredoxin)